MNASFRSMAMMAGAIVSAMTFYTVSLKVSADRARIELLEQQIATDLRQIRGLEAELRTRSRLPQLERWNDEVLALAAPAPTQFADSAVQLAAYMAEPEAPQVQYAIAKAPARAPAPVRLARAEGEASGLAAHRPVPDTRRADGSVPVRLARADLPKAMVESRSIQTASAAPIAVPPPAAQTLATGLTDALAEEIERRAVAERGFQTISLR